jgi:hypothetical protein
LSKNGALKTYHEHIEDIAAEYKSGYISQYEALARAQLLAVKNALEIARAKNYDARAASALADAAIRGPKVGGVASSGNVAKYAGEFLDSMGIDTVRSIDISASKMSAHAAGRTAAEAKKLEYRVFAKTDNLIKGVWDDAEKDLFSELGNVVQYSEEKLNTLASFRAFGESGGTVIDAADAKKYIWYGPEDMKNRAFPCARYAGVILTREQIDEINVMDWEGKSGSVWTDAGGWNCRHVLLPYS